MCVSVQSYVVFYDIAISCTYILYHIITCHVRPCNVSYHVISCHIMLQYSQSVCF